jgi:GTPase SAR1 family protein
MRWRSQAQFVQGQPTLSFLISAECRYKIVVGGQASEFRTAGFCVVGKRKRVDVKSTRVTLKIWDTAGQERHRSQVRTDVIGAAVVIMVFGVNDPTADF